MGPQTDIGELREYKKQGFYINLVNSIKKHKKKNTHLTPKKKKRK